MMHDTIPERRSADFPVFRVVNGEMGVLARLVGEIGQVVLKIEQVISELVLEPGSRVFATFVAGGLVIRQQQVLPLCDLAIR